MYFGVIPRSTSQTVAYSYFSFTPDSAQPAP
ncbi:hypothetical protein CGMCC3_g15705 [Colletotrichum fructicola]|nr:uncharacterized protein CGMCC3_g15705 [Colletotrichum fructicola]KAE9568134.1 hypothetical protein CGMCC3_g15705 [Colletotrichum fructicola]